MLRPGDIVLVGAEASVQFAGDRALMFRIIQVPALSTYDGWIWLDGYTIGKDGNAVERRSIFVQRAGLRSIQKQPSRDHGRRAA
jgi:hypothetical protein